MSTPVQSSLSRAPSVPPNLDAFQALSNASSARLVQTAPDDALQESFGQPTLLTPATAPTPSTAHVPPSVHQSSTTPAIDGGVDLSPLHGGFDDCPDNVRLIVQYLLGEGGWGSRWHALVKLYVDIERRAGFQPRGRLPKSTEHRPQEVAAWMKHHRPLTDVDIDDVDVFASGWWAWWYNNQPADRPMGGAGWYTPTNGSTASWMQLCVTGPNGLVLFLLTAAWWGAAVEDADAEAQQDWLDALEDMLYVFAQVWVAARPVSDGSSAAAPAQQRYVSNMCMCNSYSPAHTGSAAWRCPAASAP